MTMTIVAFYLDFSKNFKSLFAELLASTPLTQEERRELINW
ncbi:MAG TPA: hypothetical protein VI140_03900 [Oxalicibacterium sp.]